jgi:hypothetical protein
LDVTKIAPIGPPAATLTGGDSRGWPHSGYNLGGGPNRAARGDLLLAITCWRSLIGALGRTFAGDTFPGPVPGGTRSGGGPICVAAWGHSLGRGPDLAARGDLASAITCWRSLFGALRRARSGDTFRGRPSIVLRNRGVAPIGPYGGGALRRPEAALGGGPNFVAAWSCNLGCNLGVAPTGPLAATSP